MATGAALMACDAARRAAGEAFAMPSVEDDKALYSWMQVSEGEKPWHVHSRPFSFNFPLISPSFSAFLGLIRVVVCVVNAAAVRTPFITDSRRFTAV